MCGGKRYDRETLAVRYKGLNIAEILDLSVEQAREVFRNMPTVERILATLDEVGLGYIRLGQPATTLSGGEAQRVKLATELCRRSTGRTLYLLDEPTTGLHFDDVRKLLELLHRLVDMGNTVVVVEHNLDVIKTADWVIDLGPEGGDAGGEHRGGRHARGGRRHRREPHRPLPEQGDRGSTRARRRAPAETAAAPPRRRALSSLAAGVGEYHALRSHDIGAADGA